jgi:hypothetical protein
MFHRDSKAVAGMLTASPAASACVKENRVNADVWMLQQQFRLQRPSRFRSFRRPSAPSVGVRPVRKLGPEEKSHISLTHVVLAGSNVA